MIRHYQNPTLQHIDSVRVPGRNPCNRTNTQGEKTAVSYLWRKLPAATRSFRHTILPNCRDCSGELPVKAVLAIGLQPSIGVAVEKYDV